MSDEAPLTLGSFIASLVVLAVLGLIAWGCESESCAGRARRMQLEHDWGPVIGCMVKTKAGWRPIESIRDLDP